VVQLLSSNNFRQVTCGHYATLEKRIAREQKPRKQYDKAAEQFFAPARQQYRRIK